MIDLNKIKQRIIDSLTAEARGMVESEAQFLEDLGYPEKAETLRKFSPWDFWEKSAEVVENQQPTRLERQARGELEEIEVGDWVVYQDVPRSSFFKVDSMHDGFFEMTELGSKFKNRWLSKGLRLATPQELLDAGLIDEIPDADRVAEEERHCTDHRGPDVVKDANGEVLEVGDIVVDVVGGVGIVDSFYFHNGDWWIRFGNKVVTDYTEPMTLDEIEFHLGDRAAPDVKKLTTLTHEQYTPLARRTMPDGLTRRERLSMLVLGAMGEIKELKEVEAQDPDTHPDRRDDLIEEVGDCYWYLLLLWDELGTHKELIDQRYDRAEIPNTAEIAKKVIYHGKGENRLRRLVKAMITLVGNCIYYNNLPTDGEIRLANIRKLIERYPDGFVLGGGKR